MNDNGRVIYEGPSVLNGEPIIVIMTGLARGSNNSKTGGGLLQTFIMHADVAPHVAIKTGHDAAVCGDCPHRPSKGGACYVIAHHGPLATWRCWATGSGYAQFDVARDAAAMKGRGLRMGSYGDPAAVPLYVWLELLELVAFHTGYTHQWRTCDVEFANIVMASADSLDDRTDANAAGYRTFRVKALGDATKETGEFVCPASAERGHKTTCDACQACGGWLSKARADVVIQSHGPRAKKFGG